MAVKLYTKAAEQGDADAQFNLGDMYEKGDFVPKNDVEAVKFYKKAAEQGHVKAQFNLGQMYKLGEGTQQSDVMAVD